MANVYIENNKLLNISLPSLQAGAGQFMSLSVSDLVLSRSIWQHEKNVNMFVHVRRQPRPILGPNAHRKCSRLQVGAERKPTNAKTNARENHYKQQRKMYVKITRANEMT